jgi:serine/threonine protein kinase/TolB-like protein/tetratricopeptide (TPR) repeat protein
VDAERWTRIEAIYHAALEQEPGRRTGFVSDACASDRALEDEVLELLEADACAGSFLEQPLPDDLAEALAAVETEALIGSRIAHYEIEALIGVGGMGDVYKALDTKLGRHVALKVVSGNELDDRHSALRLLKEARHASRLNHPNVCTLHEAGEHDGHPFIVMELVEGTSLAECIPDNGFASHEMLALARQIAAAVAHAHEHGVIHGDLKALNVMVTVDQRAKVLDFGLARVRHAEGGVDAASDSVVQPAVRGTLSYLAPEVLRGARTDTRSDVWALGIVLYEIATGARPFTGATGAELAAAILTGPPAPLPPHVPAGYRAVVLRCLDKDASRRYGDASEVWRCLDALANRGDDFARPASSRTRWSAAIVAAILVTASGALVYRASQSPPHVRAGAVLPTRADLAVLPVRLTNVSPRNQHLAVALADSIITRLAGSHALLLRPVSAVLRYRDRDVDTRQVGEELAADTVLLSTLRETGSGFRFGYQLVRARDGLVVDGDTFSVANDGLEEIEELVGRRVINAFGPRQAAGRFSSPRHPTTPVAYDQYLQGRALLSANQPPETLAAVGAFEEALRIDPGFARAHAALAVACAQMAWRTTETGDISRWNERAEQEARAALESDPGLAEAHEAIAAVYRYKDADYLKVIEESRRALELNPSLELAHYHLSVAYYHLGWFDLSEAEAWAGVIANPDSRAQALFNRGRAKFYSGDFVQAVRLLEENHRFDPKALGWMLAEAYYYAGQQERSLWILEQLAASSKDTRRHAAGSLAAFRAARGERQAALRWIDIIQRDQRTDHHAAYRVGTAYAQLGDARNARRWIGIAAERGFPCYAWFARDMLLDPVRGDPAVRSLLADMRRRSLEWHEQYVLRRRSSVAEGGSTP